MLNIKIKNKIFKSDDIEKNVPHSNKDLIFLGGSLIEGHGNRLSDLDIFVITDKFEESSDFGMSYDFQNTKYMFKKINDINCDIEYWPKKVIDTAIFQINNIDFEDIEKKPLNYIDIPNYSFYRITSLIHRMINSKCVKNKNLFNQYLKELNLNSYYMMMIRHYLSRSHEVHEDVIGNYEVENYTTALFSAKEYLLLLSISLLFSNSISVDRTKWILKKLEILKNKNKKYNDLILQIENLYFGYSVKKIDDLRESIEEILELCEEIEEFINIQTKGL